ncbi:MAG: nitroreductase family protein [Promethearchaeota archaeon]
MDVFEAIEARRAYRSLDPVDVDEGLLDDLERCASLAPSCTNKQPWRFVFVDDPEKLALIFAGLPPGNRWVERSNLIVAVVSKRGMDSVLGDREYFAFDVGLATAFLLLRATELGLVAHPITGYSPSSVKDALSVPPDYTVVTLVVVGKHSGQVNPVLSDAMKLGEEQRPPRLPLREVAFHNEFSAGGGE